MCKPNVVFITLDQFRGDSLSCADHPVVLTPHLDELARHGVRLNRHFSQAAPCAPGRAALYTGMYQMNNRVVANGTPLDRRFDNVALMARRAGYRPTLFGYTDQGIDPRDSDGPEDVRMHTYEGVLPGFDCELDLTGAMTPWLDFLREMGHDAPDHGLTALVTESSRPAEHSQSRFLTDRATSWIASQTDPFFVHLSYLRPHPPFAAAGSFSEMYTEAEIPLPISPSDNRDPFHDANLRNTYSAAPTDPTEMAKIKAQYYGMISEVDANVGRIIQTLRDLDLWDNTIVVVTADHGEQLGDHGLLNKLGYFPQSYHIVGIVRDPLHPEAHGTTVQAFTENVDVFPTLCDLLNQPVPVQCDGLPLTPYLRNEQPSFWRDAAHWEFDWRSIHIGKSEHPWPWDRRLEAQHLCTLFDGSHAYIQFADGRSLCFDTATDPTWRTAEKDAATVLQMAQKMLAWRMQHADRTFTDMLLEDGGKGRIPTFP